MSVPWPASAARIYPVTLHAFVVEVCAWAGRTYYVRPDGEIQFDRYLYLSYQAAEEAVRSRAMRVERLRAEGIEVWE